MNPIAAAFIWTFITLFVASWGFAVWMYFHADRFPDYPFEEGRTCPNPPSGTGCEAVEASAERTARRSAEAPAPALENQGPRIAREWADWGIDALESYANHPSNHRG